MKPTDAAADRPPRRPRPLTPSQAARLRRALDCVDAGDHLLAGQLLLGLAREAPGQPAVWRACARRHRRLGEWAAAADCLGRVVALIAEDAAAWTQLGGAQHDAGNAAAALASVRTADSHARTAKDRLAVALEFDRQGHFDDALAAVEAALRLEPAMPVALLERSRCLKALGQADRAAADCRSLIAAGRLSARAWFSLVDLKTVALSAGELAALERATAASRDPADRQLLGFALGKALEDAGRFEPAFDALQRANAEVRAVQPWDAAAFAREVAAVRAAFSGDGLACAGPQGEEVVFLVGLPRSGTTLVEQVLASHSAVEGASELPCLGEVIDAESQRRGKPLAAWAADASPDDWTRLGQQYLRLTARWRLKRPRFTDKLPENWLHAGAALRMLPDARVVDCRRDPVETCWSCYKQLFAPRRAGFAYAFADLAAYWREYDALCRFWAATLPQRFRVQHYEALVADTGTEVRALLAACGLPFEPQCLEPHHAQRAIRTPSALQVRRPMRTVSTPAAGYGDLLAPLRDALG